MLDAIGMIDGATVQAARTRKVKRRTHRRYAALAAAAVLCILLTVPALAFAGVNQAYEVLYAISPAIAQTLKPVQMSCENNGVRMEVISAAVQGDRADIYISMQDLTGDRIDETVDLFDSYQINRPFDSSATCRLVSYDAQQKAATFLISITQWDKRDIGGDKVTFSVREFLSGRQLSEGPLPQLDLPSATQSPDTQTGIDIRGWSQPDGTRMDVESIPVLARQDDLLFSPAPGVQVTAIGYVDGKLHIQTHYDNILETDNHGYVYLKNAEDEVIYADFSISFWDEAHSGSYDEEVFDIPAEGSSGYQVCGAFWTGAKLTKGNWQVTFSLEDK